MSPRRIALASPIALAIAIAGGAARADGAADAAVAALAHRWAEITYKTPEKEQEKQLGALAADAETVVAQHAGQAAPLAWQGIILSSYAGAKGGFGAVDVAEQALDALKQAAKIDETALGGGIDTSIGALYYKVPGWPIGFGDDDAARDYLLKGLALNPDGIDENYFFGDFLIEQGEKMKAREYLERALKAPPRPGREDADAGRRQDIEADLAKLES